MLSRITAAYADTSAAQLSLRLGLGVLDAHAAVTVRLGGSELDLRVLGSSHQVVLRAPAAEYSEVVACLPERDGGLPERAARSSEGADYAFRSSVLVRDSRALAAEAARLTEAYQDHACAIVGVFPGAPSALTAVAAWPLPAGVGWRTWHLYPQTGEIVTTTSEVSWR